MHKRHPQQTPGLIKRTPYVRMLVWHLFLGARLSSRQTNLCLYEVPKPVRIHVKLRHLAVFCYKKVRYFDVNESVMAQNHVQGFLLPPWYVPLPPASQQEMDIASVLFGSSLALAVFTLVKGTQQTMAAFRGSRLRNMYVFLIWATWLPSLAMSIHTWLYVLEVVQSR